MEKGSIIKNQWGKHVVVRMLDNDYALTVYGRGNNPRIFDYNIVDIHNSQIFFGNSRPLRGYREGYVEIGMWANGNRVEVLLKGIDRLDGRVGETLVELWEASKRWLRPV